MKCGIIPYQILSSKHDFHDNQLTAVMLYTRASTNFCTHFSYFSNDCTKIGTEQMKIIWQRTCKFREKQCSENQTLSKGVKKIVPPILIKFSTGDVHKL
jgi:hypothetical protein